MTIYFSPKKKLKLCFIFDIHVCTGIWYTTKEVRQQDIIITASKFDFTEATYLLMKT